MKVLIVDDRALIVADLEDEVKRIRPDAECTGTTSPPERRGHINSVSLS